jgi:hypothetical protein
MMILQAATRQRPGSWSSAPKERPIQLPVTTVTGSQTQSSSSPGGATEQNCVAPPGLGIISLSIHRGLSPSAIHLSPHSGLRSLKNSMFCFQTLNLRATTRQRPGS